MILLRSVVPLAVTAVVLLTGCGGAGEGTAASGVATSQPPKSPRVDSEDPTPETEGRMTAEEEEAAYAAGYKLAPIALAQAQNQARVYGWDEAAILRQTDKLATGYILAELSARGVDVEDIKRRDAEATADGFPVEQGKLALWRRADQGDDEGNSSTEAAGSSSIPTDTDTDTDESAECCEEVEPPHDPVQSTATPTPRQGQPGNPAECGDVNADLVQATLVSCHAARKLAKDVTAAPSCAAPADREESSCELRDYTCLMTASSDPDLPWAVRCAVGGDSDDDAARVTFYVPAAG